MLLCLWVQKRGSSLRSGWGYWMARGWRNNKQRSLLILILTSISPLHAFFKEKSNYMGFVLSLHTTTYHFCPPFLSFFPSFCHFCLVFFCFYALSPRRSFFVLFSLVLLIIYVRLLIFSCLADHVLSDWQPPIIILGVWLRSPNGYYVSNTNRQGTQGLKVRTVQQVERGCAPPLSRLVIGFRNK